MQIDSIDNTDIGNADLPGDALHAFLAECRATGPVTPITFAGQPAFLITGHAELAAAFRDNARFPPANAYRVTIEPVQGLTFQTMEDDDHRVYRKLATPAFRAKAIERMETGSLVSLAQDLVDELPGGGCDFRRLFTHRYPFIVISRMLGIPCDREAEFHQWASGFLAFTRDPAHAQHCADQISEYLRPILEDRRRQPREDVISELIKADVDGVKLTDEDILANVRLLFTAGASTTADALGSLLYALLSDRSRWDAVRQDPGLRINAIEELLRWESPVAILPRISAPEPIHFAGQDIPANTFCLFAMAAANRDPRVFPGPDTFDMNRDSSGKLLSFGPGPRLCPGMHLARKQLAVVLDVLLERLPDLALADVAAAQPRGTVLRGPASLEVSYR